MGYTHYWEIKEGVPLEKFERFAELANEIINVAGVRFGIRIADWSGEFGGEWQADNEKVSFNGYSEESYETFRVKPLDYGLNSCKTGEMPYDTVVTACLVALKHAYGDDVRIMSDGGLNEWVPGEYLFMVATDIPSFHPVSETL